MTSATGAITMTSCGMTRLVMPMNARMVWPWPVIRSTSRNAWVSQMALVRLTSTSRNAPKVVRKIYRPIDPIRLRRPTFGRTARAPDPTSGVPHVGGPIPHLQYALMRSTKWLRNGKPVEHAQQTVNAEGCGGPARAGLAIAGLRARSGRALQTARTAP